MARGKQTCKILKEIRRQIAEANGIEFATSECRYKGDCLGTCPKCESEVRYLEQQLRDRSLAGKAIALAGISAASLAMLMPMTSGAQTLKDIKALPGDSTVVTRSDSLKVKGTVKYTTDSDSIVTEKLIGATVVNLTSGKGTATDIDGKFEIEACKGDSIRISFIGYFPETICVKSPSYTVQIVLTEDRSALQGEVVFVGAMPVRKENHYLNLDVNDGKGNVIVPEDLYIERICIIRKTKRRTEINRSGPKLKRNVTRRKTKRTSGYAFLIGRPTLFSLQNRPGFAGVRADARRSPLHHSNYI